MEHEFKTCFEIALKKGIDIKQELGAVKAFQNIELTLRDDDVDNTIANTQEQLKETIQTVRSIQANKSELKNSGIFQGNTGRSTTTTPEIGHDKPKVRLDRLGKISIIILDIIRDNGAVTSHEICNKLNKTNHYVMRYLYRLQEYRYIYRNNENWKWYLSELDNDFYRDLDCILYIIYNVDTKETQRRHKGDTKETRFTK